MGQKDFWICLFLFDVNKNPNTPSESFQFFAVNPKNYSKDDLEHLDAGPILSEVINGV